MSAAARARRGAARAACAVALLAAGLAGCNRLPDETWLRIVAIQDENGGPVTSLAVDVADRTVTEAVNVEIQNQTSTVGAGGGGVGILLRRIRVQCFVAGATLPALESPATLYLAPGAESGTALSVAVFPPSLKEWVGRNLFVPDGGLEGSARITLYAVTDEGRELESSGGLAVRLLAGSGGGGGGGGTGLPSVTVQATDATATDTTVSTGEFEIRRSSTSGSLTVKFTLGGTASGSDYGASPSSQVTLASGAASAKVTITPAADATAEGSETVVLTISSDAAYTVGSASSATVTITD